MGETLVDRMHREIEIMTRRALRRMERRIVRSPHGCPHWSLQCGSPRPVSLLLFIPWYSYYATKIYESIALLYYDTYITTVYDTSDSVWFLSLIMVFKPH